MHRSIGSILPQSSRTITIVLAVVQVLKIMVLQLLLKRQVVELAAQSELPVDFLLTNREVFDVEEADMLGSIGQLLDEVLLALWSVK